jgi:hypothetical protein
LASLRVVEVTVGFAVGFVFEHDTNAEVGRLGSDSVIDTNGPRKGGNGLFAKLELGVK